MFPRVSFELPDWIRDEIGDPSRPYAALDERMDLALRLAERNVSESTGGPFGACVFEMASGRLVGAGVNLVLSTRCSLAHAEAMAIMIAQKTCNTFDLAAEGLPAMELIASAQPCIQCYGILWWSGLRRLVIGATARDVESLLGFAEGPLPPDWSERLDRRSPLPSVEVITDCLRPRARQVLRRYRNEGGTIYNPGFKKTD